VLLPALGRAKERARTVQCSNQLRQLGFAMQMYAEDHEQFLPQANGSVPWTSTNPVPWMRVLLDYYQATNVLRCPSLSQRYEKSPYNYFMGSRAVFVATGARGRLKLSAVRFPSQYILSGDSNFPFVPDDADQDNYSQDTLFEFTPPPSHNQTVNVLFADFHVKNYRKFDPGEMTYALDRPGVSF
jgi:prepilin-type processing-associated H-X9-DG protein